MVNEPSVFEPSRFDCIPKYQFSPRDSKTSSISHSKRAIGVRVIEVLCLQETWCIGMRQTLNLNADSSTAEKPLYEAKRKKTPRGTCATSEELEQPALSRSLHRRNLARQGRKPSSRIQRRLRSDCAFAQSDLSLRWAHISKCTIPDVAAYIISVFKLRAAHIFSQIKFINVC